MKILALLIISALALLGALVGAEEIVVNAPMSQREYDITIMIFGGAVFIAASSLLAGLLTNDKETSEKFIKGGFATIIVAIIVVGVDDVPGLFQSLISFVFSWVKDLIELIKS